MTGGDEDGFNFFAGAQYGAYGFSLMSEGGVCSGIIRWRGIFTAEPGFSAADTGLIE